MAVNIAQVKDRVDSLRSRASAGVEQTGEDQREVLAVLSDLCDAVAEIDERTAEPSSPHPTLPGVSRRRARVVLAIAWILPLLLFLFVLMPLAQIVGLPYGPVIRIGESPWHLDLWAALTILGALLAALPGSLMAYRLRGTMGVIGLLVWLLFLSGLAFRVGRWIE
ncbi:MAG TPA: hypothetical protein VOA80_17155 [Thermoanaerobaculia bacterium]|nr:hypothetical protein [Thermoanaerobaculia bacterium]